MLSRIFLLGVLAIGPIVTGCAKRVGVSPETLFEVSKKTLDRFNVTIDQQLKGLVDEPSSVKKSCLMYGRLFQRLSFEEDTTSLIDHLRSQGFTLATPTELLAFGYVAPRKVPIVGGFVEDGRLTLVSLVVEGRFKKMKCVAVQDLGDCYLLGVKPLFPPPR